MTDLVRRAPGGDVFAEGDAGADVSQRIATARPGLPGRTPLDHSGASTYDPRP
jgi:hypothetical protein